MSLIRIPGDTCLRLLCWYGDGERKRTRKVTKADRLRRGQMRAAAKWLQSLVGEDWGIRVLPAGADKPRPVHANRNKRFEAVIMPGGSGMNRQD